jgi:hypothetical protein
MSKPHKVEEPAGTYSASPKQRARPAASARQHPAKPAIRYADAATFRKAADKVFEAHDELFRKLAR